MSDSVLINLSERPRILWAGSDDYTRIKRTSFQLKDIWCMHYYQYSARITHNDAMLPIRPGSVGICEPYARIAYDEFAGDEREHMAFNFHLPEAYGDFQWRIPLMVSPGDSGLDDVRSRFERVIQLHLSTPQDKPISLNAEVELWALLLAISEEVGAPAETSAVDRQGRRHVRSAMRMIDTHLATDIYAEKIAKHLGISVTHLGRLFNKHAGCPVATFIRRKRLRYAHRQLAYSNEPIQEIAASVGIDDLANFNRFIRSEFGQSPKQIRGRKRDSFLVREID
ncbi:AraC family transcriptional regulator [Rubellicoccus peritrichatus]|uniref:AraC family transcriptional regulator n=1 Tax=Rubellicoccus peritrichatus TaxID=3080537 RepID=A0AAQ3QX27_9BACT|nr:AraC family transcriptional regulator [Puniceicoccus sp. CR14]WOO42572.1 AraC family transcriptional regulator [Puniceicoccus sp. CR14]